MKLLEVQYKTQWGLDLESINTVFLAAAILHSEAHGKARKPRKPILICCGQLHIARLSVCLVVRWHDRFNVFVDA
jgi:hypothetical protein